MQQLNGCKYILYVDETFDPGTIIHVRARLAYFKDPSLIDDDGTFDLLDDVAVSDWSHPKRTVYGASNAYDNSNWNYNYNYGGYDYYKQGDSSNDKGHDTGRDYENKTWRNEEKLKIKCMITTREKVVKKSVTLCNHKGEFKCGYDTLVKKIRKMRILRNIADFQIMEIIFTVDGKHEVANQQDFEMYCLDVPVTDDGHGYICMSTDGGREFIPA